MSQLKLLAFNSDAKTIKGMKKGWLTFIMYLAPSRASIPFGGRDTCPWASPGCSAACLFTAGRAQTFPKINQARIRKTLWYFENRAEFMAQLHEDIAIAVRLAKLRGLKPCFRLNGTSDISWHKVALAHPKLQFYDYTKGIERILNNDISNYHFTFSRSEENGEDALKVLAAGKNAAFVFSQPIPRSWMGYRVIDGDQNDLRFLDPKGVIVALKAKGRARHDESGFVVHQQQKLEI
jgi:hypothetical protein